MDNYLAYNYFIIPVGSQIQTRRCDFILIFTKIIIKGIKIITINITIIIGFAPVLNFCGFHLHFKIQRTHSCTFLISLKNSPAAFDVVPVIFNYIDQDDMYIEERDILISLHVLLIPCTCL